MASKDKSGTVWYVLGGLALAAGLGALIWYLVDEHKKSEKKQVVAIAAGSSASPYQTQMAHQHHANQVQSGQQYAAQKFAGHAQYRGAAAQRARQHQVAQQDACPDGPEPSGYYPYGQHQAANYDASYPNAEDLASKYPRGCGGAGPSQGYELNIDSLMPSSWKGPKNCGTDSAADSQWSKYAPSKQAFDRYITAAGSARLSLNTRSPLARQTGIPLLLRQGPAVPISAQEYPWGDSSFRQDLVFRQEGRYPTSTSC